jgi:hypothetical protein
MMACLGNSSSPGGGDEVISERTGGEIRAGKIDEVVARAQARTRRLLGNQPEALGTPLSWSGAAGRLPNDYTVVIHLIR